MMYRYGPGHGGGNPMMGGFGLLALLFGVVVVVIVVLLVLWAVRASGPHHQAQQSPHPVPPQPVAPPKEDPCEIARLRYARGEIKKKEYEEICRTLTS